MKKESPSPGRRNRPRKAASPRKFTPVPVRARRDGWSADKQYAFIEALAATGCVEEACAMVGMGRTSAYALLTRSDSTSFRIAWGAALDVGMLRLESALLGRAINGTARPIFYHGEQVGERRFYNDRTAMFLLRYRQAERFGKWRDQEIGQRVPDGASLILDQAVDHMMDDATADDLGLTRTPRPPLALRRTIDQQAWEAEQKASRKRHRGGT